ncbi:MAG: hypothetical protein JJT81_07185 [Rubellimicrobium sp.]|nr:hypothetical protein [Rubellimicrobium sp.]
MATHHHQHPATAASGAANNLVLAGAGWRLGCVTIGAAALWFVLYLVIG